MEIPTFTLSNGIKIPAIGYGTSRTTVNLDNSLEVAIRAGYSQIDTAHLYGNEETIGNTLQRLFKDKVVKREDLFITTKLPPQFLRKEDVEPMLRKQLQLLQLSYVDLYLVHMPFGVKKVEGNLFPIENGLIVADPVDYLETWKAMEEVYNKNLTKAIGLSNFSPSQIKRIFENSTVKPHNLQLLCHAYWPQEELYQLCKQFNILMTAYAPLGSPGWLQGLRRVSADMIPDEVKNKPKLMEDICLNTIAKKYNKTAAQVLLRWLFQRGINAIPKSVNADRIKENINIFDFTLSDEDFYTLSNLETRDFLFGMTDRIFRQHPQYCANEPH